MTDVTGVAAAATFRRNPILWLEENNLSRGFWTYFAASLFFDAGFCVYFFVFNLYLLDLHFRESFIGLVSGSMTVGSVLVMLPAGVLSRKIGVRRLLMISYLSAPLVHVVRTLWVWAPAQLALAMLGGMALSSSGVCYLPIVARLTNEKNRAAAFSLIFSAALASSAVGAAICGYIPRWLQHAGLAMSATQTTRIILIISCAVALLAVIPAARLRPSDPEGDQSEVAVARPWLESFSLSSSAVRLLLPITLWAIVLAAFFPFGNVFLASRFRLPLEQISFIFSAAQVVQLCMLGATPVVLRLLGKANGLLAIQSLTGITLGILACTNRRGTAIGLFLLFTALQWMANPALYDLMMSSTPDPERESASALMLFCNAVVSALTTPCVGCLYARFGYRGPLIGIGILALIVAAFSRIPLAPGRTASVSKTPAEPSRAGNSIACSHSTV